MARQNVALRGHYGEVGCIDPNNEPVDNDGNFRAMLRYRAHGGDSDLLSHIKSAKANTTYQSAKIQNELIIIAGTMVKETISSQMQKAKCWTILADDTMDRQKREQCAICVRYASKDSRGK